MSADAIMKALHMAVLIAGGGYISGYVQPMTCAIIFVYIIWQGISSGGGGSAETAKIVGEKAPDVPLTDPASGNSGSLLKDYVGSGKPVMIDFYQSVSK
jgi:hypothetical protein